MFWKFGIVVIIVALATIIFVFRADAPETMMVLLDDESSISTSSLIVEESLPEVKLSPIVEIFPDLPIQGEPVKVVLKNITDVSLIKQATFDSKPVHTFPYNGELIGFIGFDLNNVPGIYSVSIEFTDGYALTKNILFGERKKYEEPLGIPEKLGGNTPESEQALLSTLASENAELSNIYMEKDSLFTEAFEWPLKTVEITDEYGYTRNTGSVSIAHKGTDFRASIGTKVFATNSGIVRISKEFRNYGNTVVIDHGAGIITMYMHLSKRSVSVGDTITRGEEIGLSGDTGYAESPHLHFTVRVNNVSIDPIAFYKLF